MLMPVHCTELCPARDRTKSHEETDKGEHAMRYLFLLFIVALICGCEGGRDETGLVGKWQEQDTAGRAPRVLEFRKDGKYTETAGDLKTRGNWELTDGNQLTLSMEVMGDSMGTTFTMEFQNGDLMIDSMRYKRVE
jgi:uncharacterized protein (TIGR03066 family)